MRVAVLDVDGKLPNLALMKISAWHKQRGDEVEHYMPFDRYDICYVAKIFNFSQDYLYPIYADKIVRGGTGYDISSQLPSEIEAMQPDYSLYPDWPADTALGFLTRGCPNKCPWCVVPRKEGRIRPYRDVDEVAAGRSKLVLMDNNILAAGDYAIEQLDKIVSRGYHVDFNQALDARLVDEAFAERLAKIKWIHSRIRFGCDTHAQIGQCQRAMDLLHLHGFRGEFFLYTMIGGGNGFRECYNRINHWRQRLMEFRRTHNGNAVYCHAQPYRDPDKADPFIPQWQKDMARWCNKKMFFVKIDFINYEPRKGFKCKQYFYEN